MLPRVASVPAATTLYLVVLAIPSHQTDRPVYLHRTPFKFDKIPLVIGVGSNLGAKSGRIVMRRLLKDLRTDERGVTMVEYALIAGLISVVAIALLTATGTSIVNIFTSINNALTTA